MVVDEKGLTKAMTSAYKSGGYEVGFKDTGSDIEVIISVPGRWAIVIKKECLPRKILGMIAEHVGDLPAPGAAYQVKKKEVQTKIFNHLKENLLDFHSDPNSMESIKRTNLVWKGRPIWQTERTKRIVQIDPEDENIMYWSSSTVRLVNDQFLFIDDSQSRAYVHCLRGSDEETTYLEHLAKMDWSNA